MQSLCDRVTVFQNLYHQPLNSEAIQVSTRFSRELVTMEQAWIRKTVVTEEWASIDTGWLKRVSLLHVANEEGKHHQVLLSEEEKAWLAHVVVELGFFNGIEVIPLQEILPGEGLHLSPISGDVKHHRIRCRSGSAQVTITAIPT